MKNPWAAVDSYSNEEKKADSDFERQVMKRLIDAGYRVRAQWQVGYYRIDLVVEGDGKRLAIECDGDRYHPLEKLEDDIARQTVLERLGWQFVRIRGSAFYRSQTEVMKPIFDRLEALEIPAVGQIAEERRDNWILIHELEELVRKESMNEEAGSFAGGAMNDEESPKPESRGYGDGLGSVTESETEVLPSSNLDLILRAYGCKMPLENFVRVWANVRGHKRIGKNIRERFDVELAEQIRQETLIVAGEYISIV